MRPFVIAISIFFIAVLSSFFLGVTSASEYSVGVISQKESYDEEEPEVFAKPLPFSIRFVGDILLARRIETLMDKYGSGYPFSRLPEVASSTILVGNFEAAIPEKHVHTPDLTYLFSVDVKNLKPLGEYGFTTLSLANNHSYDFDESGFEHTRNALVSDLFTPFGNPTTNSTTSIVFLETQYTNVSLIGVHATKVLPTDAEIKNLLDYASEHSDLQVIFVHWGTEYKLKHNTTQEVLAHTFVDLGADAVVGHHPHVVQDIEMYNGAPIFYSLGNFIFDQYFSDDVQEGLMLDMLMNSEDKIIFQILPITSIDLHSVPRVMSRDESTIFLTNLAKRSQDELRIDILTGKIVVPITQ